ncbi:hypothetical protein KFL_000780040 [Klebsormidium nitens]|uniref:Uncharacterized protein n=1 Tax=Klebsormidium nitens TaxID=105231 RepID=A0A1Y1HU30_KLENI|nr:hypothetical protein KFL_000780040 [Klebsormidium nitens]|eukprot:GAQ81342.1 hypothetical protein KFL_000780040 [Klebsormidium nitens]
MKALFLCSLISFLFVGALLALSYLLPTKIHVAESPDKGAVYVATLAIATLLPACFGVHVCVALLVAANVSISCNLRALAETLNLLTSALDRFQNPVLWVRTHPWRSGLCLLFLGSYFSFSQLLTASNGRYLETTPVQNATVTGLGGASSFGGCTGRSCILTSDKNFPIMVEQIGNVTAATYAHEINGAWHYAVFPDPSEINQEAGKTKFQRLHQVHAARYTFQCDKSLAPTAQFNAAATLFNDTKLISARSSVTLTSQGVLQLYLGLEFQGIEGYSVYWCLFNASKEIVDVVWQSTAGALSVVNVTNPAPYNGTWVPEVTKPLTSLSLVFSNTLAWWFASRFYALTSQEAKDFAVERVAHAFIQTVLLRGAQTTDDTYVNQSDVLTDTWWVVDQIRARAWFRTFLAAAAAFGAAACFFLAILWACSGGGVRYTGEWRPLQSEGLDAGAEVAPKTRGIPSGGEVELDAAARRQRGGV